MPRWSWKSIDYPKLFEKNIWHSNLESSKTIRKSFKPISKPLKRIASSLPKITASSSPQMTIAPPPVKQTSPEIKTHGSFSEGELDKGNDIERSYPQIFNAITYRKY
ncbi:hypothetical protein JTB14_008269 [Gonioctena quinquepunctata]|nr:hypothetical protein JTB14_008269 [Gonioctena quinquepunctata]